uniref:Cytochrome b n=1 Tax=Lepidochelys olivacea TaxID=27788 RepID=B6GV47_LEPOA|nr:cytochrome b [Lepidochelys olivacea]
MATNLRKTHPMMKIINKFSSSIYQAPLTSLHDETSDHYWPPAWHYKSLLESSWQYITHQMSPWPFHQSPMSPETYNTDDLSVTHMPTEHPYSSYASTSTLGEESTTVPTFTKKPETPELSSYYWWWPLHLWATSYHEDKYHFEGPPSLPTYYQLFHTSEMHWYNESEGDSQWTTQPWPDSSPSTSYYHSPLQVLQWYIYYSYTKQAQTTQQDWTQTLTKSLSTPTSPTKTYWDLSWYWPFSWPWHFSPHTYWETQTTSHQLTPYPPLPTSNQNDTSYSPMQSYDQFQTNWAEYWPYYPPFWYYSWYPPYTHQNNEQLHFDHSPKSYFDPWWLIYWYWHESEANPSKIHLSPLAKQPLAFTSWFYFSSYPWRAWSKTKYWNW